jgi:uncharacterized membrane protein
MAKKLDTNPLDPTFPEKVRETEREVQTVTLPKQNGKTRKFAEPVETEDQTRKFTEAEFNSFHSTFGNEENQPVNYQPRPLYVDKPDVKKTHNIGSISLPENVLIALPYIPFGPIGIIAAIIELIFIPRSEPKIRYHAAQGLAAQSGVWIISAILGSMGWISGFSELSSIFWIITTIMLIVFAVKAWQGKPIHIASVESLTDLLEEKIKPQK